jgi:DNA-binding FadR family transcriptional regulator
MGFRSATDDGSPPEGLSERLTQGIVDLIVELGLVPGEALPTVRELAVRFAVTAPTVREALRRLQATDAVRPRHGSGVYVGPGFDRTLLANPTPAPTRPDAVLDLIAARLTIEPGIAALAAEHRTPGQLARLEVATATALTEPGQRPPKLNFHRELAACSGNRVLFEVIDSLLVARRRDQRAVRTLIEDRGRDHAEHWAIYRAVADRDAARAPRLTRDHLLRLRDTVAARLTTEA